MFIYFALEAARLAFCSGVLFLLQHNHSTGSGEEHHGHIQTDHGGITGVGSGQLGQGHGLLIADVGDGAVDAADGADAVANLQVRASQRSHREP